MDIGTPVAYWAPADPRTTVLILGESGTGKTMTARAIHQLSDRRDKPFVEVACVKDYPGSWAEYRVFEGGVLQVHRRISTPFSFATPAPKRWKAH